MNSILKDKILNGDKRSLAKAITLIESSKEEHHQTAQSLLESLISETGKSIRIGISGVPGVGKSTFIEAFGLELIKLGKKVAVLAVDPSSPVSGGSIMGDKTRMEKLSQNSEAFIRPSPSTGSLGGVAKKTRESMLFCEAAGFDIILVETVGVGQSEYEVSSMVDFFLVLMLPNAGDELQGIKKGIIELADALIINKCDGDSISLAKRSVSQYEGAFQILQTRDEQNTKSFWSPKVLTCSALENKGILEIWNMIKDFSREFKKKNLCLKHRENQNIIWMNQLLEELIHRELLASHQVNKVKNAQEMALKKGSTTPYLAAKNVFSEIRKK